MSFPGRPSRDQGTRNAVAAQPAATDCGAVNRGVTDAEAPDCRATDGGAVKPAAPNSGTAKPRVLEKWRERRLQPQQWGSHRLPLDRLPVRRLWLKIPLQTGLTLRGLSLKRVSPKNLSLKRLSPKNLSLNRGDLLLLVAGVVAFFVLTFLPGVVAPGNMAGGTGARPAAVPHFSSLTTTGPRETIPPDTFAWNGGAAAAKSGKGSAATAPTTQAPQPHLPANFPPAAAPTRIVYPAAGLDVVIHPLNPSQEELDTQAIVPPITMDGYWVTNFGTPGIGSTNTTYILGHSWEDRDAPFNRLSSASTPGDIFEATTEAGTIRYRVESVDTYSKATLKDSPIWTAVPNRLVLISCYAEDLWGKNVVVVASPVLEP
jgi:hypothetical protein